MPEYAEQRERILKTDLLVVDEISMLSAKLLGMLDFVCCGVRGSEVRFGGMQVILSGDFYQLPPVANCRYHDDGKKAFNSESWEAIQHSVYLREVIRQEEQDLMKVFFAMELLHRENIICYQLRPLYYKCNWWNVHVELNWQCVGASQI